MKFESNPMVIKPQQKSDILGKTVGEDYYKQLKKKQSSFVYTDKNVFNHDEIMAQHDQSLLREFNETIAINNTPGPDELNVEDAHRTSTILEQSSIIAPQVYVPAKLDPKSSGFHYRPP